MCMSPKALKIGSSLIYSLFSAVQERFTIEAIYTDGSGGYGAYGGRGVCGYAAIVWLWGDRWVTLGGVEAHSTHQRAELLALIVALNYLQELVLKEPVLKESVLQESLPDRSIPIFSDSKYAVDALNHDWIDKWQQNGWLNTKGRPIADRDLWLQLRHLQKTIRFPVTFHHVMAHSDALGKKGRLAQLKNRDRFGANSEQHNRGNQRANLVAGQFRRGETVIGLAP
jgi:ribonuclease HI